MDEAPESITEMTGTNCTMDAARNGPEKQRPLLRTERLADGNLFPRLTTHANGGPFTATYKRQLKGKWALTGFRVREHLARSSR
jgi:hypothetical protein